MIKIDEAFIENVSQQAKATARRRMNYNFHHHDSDTLQRMLNAMEPDTYIRPHKHELPDKSEAFFCLRGRILVVEFDDKGNIKEGVDIRKAKLIAMSNFDKTDPKCKGCTIRDFCHGMKCGYMNFINTGKINVPSDAECIFEHIFYKAMVQILEYYLQQPIEIVREKLGVYIDYIQEEDLKFSEFGEKIAKRLGDER